jgi:hypothetical protein
MGWEFDPLADVLRPATFLLAIPIILALNGRGMVTEVLGI